MEKCLPRLERGHGSLKGEVPRIKAAEGSLETDMTVQHF